MTSVIDEKSVCSSKDFLKKDFDVYKKSDKSMLKTLSKNSSLPLINKSQDAAAKSLIAPKIIGNDALKIRTFEVNSGTVSTKAGTNLHTKRGPKKESTYINKISTMLKKAPYSEYTSKNLQNLQKM